MLLSRRERLPEPRVREARGTGIGSRLTSDFGLDRELKLRENAPRGRQARAGANAYCKKALHHDSHTSGNTSILQLEMETQSGINNGFRIT